MSIFFLSCVGNWLIGSVCRETIRRCLSLPANTSMEYKTNNGMSFCMSCQGRAADCIFCVRFVARQEQFPNARSCWDTVICPRVKTLVPCCQVHTISWCNSSIVVWAAYQTGVQFLLSENYIGEFAESDGDHRKPHFSILFQCR